MKFMATKGARSMALLALVATVAACGLPRSGPNKREIFSSSELKMGDAFVVSVNDHVTRATGVVPALGSAPAYRRD